MITSFDDYPVHQTAEPVAVPATGDRNAYDRYFFNGYDPDRGWFFGVALGVYPNRQVIDASFSVLHDGVQRSVHASGRAPTDRALTRVGPISVEVVEPLRVLRVRVDAPEQGLSAELVFTARTPAVEEPRFTRHNGPTVVMDYTRLTQWGTWQGRFGTGADTVECAGARGTRDRSWGVRTVGEPPGGAPPRALPQFFWLWAPLHFDDHCTHLAVVDDAAGRHVYESACRVPLLPGADEATPLEHARTADVDIDLLPGVRRSASATLRLACWDGKERITRLTPLLTFQMRGIGYFHPRWAHGVWHGESAVGGSQWRVAELDPAAPENVHVQQLVRAEGDGQVGIGVFESLMIGPHAPLGLTGLFDVPTRP
ncbi:hypothetical protein [Pseudonocardia humida]|uniref:Tocopherol cyclase-like protein n=1 Tax=Pseudonocardia humida TaxID=2800819 RepID=A0ABT0ZZP5_9PSEU|nr:hypothetical protein [Pseudonocardia humida]MCO1656229.1 hypothetical protein [Pseudonocardia humida]